MFRSSACLTKVFSRSIGVKGGSTSNCAGRISKELKALHKNVWPTFPLQIGMFSLLDFGHSKVEAAALRDINFFNIEFKKHDP
jgi:hypothetical protein